MATPDSDYLKLIQLGGKIAQNSEGYPEVKIAIIGDSSTQHLAMILKACLYRHRLFAHLYESEFDVIDQEVLSSDSGLYRFAPEYVLLHVVTQPLRDWYYRNGFEGHRLAEEVHARTIERWRMLNERLKCRIIQNLFVLPIERTFGNFSWKVPDSLHAGLAELNSKIAVSSRQFPNVFLNDVEHLASCVGKRSWNDEKLWAHGKILCRLEFMPEFAENVASIILAGAGRMTKCVALDLDNTLWGGFIGDDGLNGIEIGEHGVGEAYARFQAFLLSLKARGVILTVCSKNNPENALAPFREHPGMVLREKDISLFVANWNSKAENLRLIAKTLNIGLDSIVFVDDSPFERNQVRGLVPEICVPEMPEDPADYAQYLSRLNLFETVSLSAEDAQRTDLYRTQIQRDQQKAKFSNVDDYLKSLAMEAVIARFDPISIARIAQLIQRSNQFNLTTRRYNEKECETFMRDTEGCLPLYISLKDKFGDYGLIGVIIGRVQPPKLVIDSWLMSCRVLQRGVEHLCMNRVFELAKRRGLQMVRGIYIPTAKNSMVQEFYSRFGFRPVDEAVAVGHGWELAVADYRPKPVFIDCPESAI